MTEEISQEEVYELFFKTMRRAAQVLPADVRKALKDALSIETDPIARLHLETFLKNADLGEEKCTFVCPDTGWQIFYVKLGDKVKIEGGLSSLQEIARRVVAELTAAGNLRPTLADPLTRKSFESNVGAYYPRIKIVPDPGVESIEVTAVPKGGGSEAAGTFYRMLLPADGINGILRFVVECFLASSYSGKTCPPNIIGVGIGGTADMCNDLAKEAAVLRIIGDRNPDPAVAKLELELLSALNDLGVGPMGAGGKVGVLDIHLEKAAVHTGTLPVAFNAQCSLAKRATGSLNAEKEVLFLDNPKWRAW
jgi:tartrate/fumarate subfamily iron-sulfur-dependent hydro-lyase alpha chain